MAAASRCLKPAYRGRHRPSREYRDNLPIFMPLEPAVSLDLFLRQQERLEQIMGIELASYFQYEARAENELPQSILTCAPRSEAKAVFRIAERLGMTVEKVIGWISVSPSERKLIERSAGLRAATEACNYRDQVLSAFLNLVGKREETKCKQE
jgi:hypothetical protein